MPCNADLHSLAYAPIYVSAVHAHNYGNNKFRREDEGTGNDNFYAALFNFSSLDKSITAAGHGSSRRRPCWYPPSLGAPSHTLHHSPVTQRPGWDRTSNPWTREAALLPVSHRSLVGACEGTYIWLLIRESPIKKLKCLGFEPMSPSQPRLQKHVCIHWTIMGFRLRFVFEGFCWMRSF